MNRPKRSLMICGEWGPPLTIWYVKILDRQVRRTNKSYFIHIPIYNTYVSILKDDFGKLISADTHKKEIKMGWKGYCLDTF